LFIIIFKGLEIESDEKTLDEIIKNNKSISRFGDGEYSLIFGENISFQQSNNILSKKLTKILRNNEKNFLVGINFPYKLKIINKYISPTKLFWTNYINKYKFNLSKIINKKKKYYSATISRFYMSHKDKNKNHIWNYIKQLKKIWDHKNVLIIEGEKSRIGVGNNLFDNIKSIKRIICPVINAFFVYKKIIKEVLNLNEKRLILIALGPTATILAYDLYKLGYQAIDIGHVDIEYEWFLKNAKNKIQIKNKYVNEVNGGNYNFTKLKDKKYYNQIIAKIKNENKRNI
jgi:glycosyltransferase family protein